MARIHNKQIRVKDGIASSDGDSVEVDTSVLPDDWQTVTFYECMDSGNCFAEVEFVQDPFAKPNEFKANKTLSKKQFENHVGCNRVFEQWASTLRPEEEHAVKVAEFEEENLIYMLEEAEDNVRFMSKDDPALNKAIADCAKLKAKQGEARTKTKELKDVRKAAAKDFKEKGMASIPKKPK